MLVPHLGFKHFAPSTQHQFVPRHGQLLLAVPLVPGIRRSVLNYFTNDDLYICKLWPAPIADDPRHPVTVGSLFWHSN
jgi:hypothetical protein